MSRPLVPLVMLATVLLVPVLPFAAGPTPAVPATPTMVMAHEMPNATFTLRTGITQGKMVYKSIPRRRLATPACRNSASTS